MYVKLFLSDGLEIYSNPELNKNYDGIRSNLGTCLSRIITKSVHSLQESFVISSIIWTKRCFDEIFFIRLMKNKFFGSVFNMTSTAMFLLRGEITLRSFLVNELIFLSNHLTRDDSSQCIFSSWCWGGS